MLNTYVIGILHTCILKSSEIHDSIRFAYLNIIKTEKYTMDLVQNMTIVSM
jgi:hypothetical protein